MGDGVRKLVADLRDFRAHLAEFVAAFERLQIELASRDAIQLRGDAGQRSERDLADHRRQQRGKQHGAQRNPPRSPQARGNLAPQQTSLSRDANFAERFFAEIERQHHRINPRRAVDDAELVHKIAVRQLLQRNAPRHGLPEHFGVA